MAKSTAAPPSGDRRSFWCLCATMFQGAFNDNAYKLLLIFMAGRVAAHGTHSKDFWEQLAGVAFLVPFLLFSFLAGQLADRFSKARIAVWTKVLELAIMLTATAVLFEGESQPVLMVSIGLLALMGFQSTIFSPAKYGLVPELLPEDRLSWGNGWIDALTFLAIILGTVYAPKAVVWFPDSPWMRLLPMVALAVVGVVTAGMVRRVPAAEPARRLSVFPADDLAKNWAEIRRSQELLLSIIGLCAWWGAAVVIQFASVKLGEDTLRLTESQTANLFQVMAVGIAIGSYVAGRISHSKVELGIVPVGAVGMAAGCLAIGLMHFGAVPSGTDPDSFLPRHAWVSAAALGISGLFAGFFNVPLLANVQRLTDRETRGGIMAMMSWGTNIAMVFALAVYMAATVGVGQVAKGYGLDAPGAFLGVGLFVLVTAGFILWLMPITALRFVLVALTSTIYRMRIGGRINIPERGGALIIANHMSFVDGFLVQAGIDRPIRPILYAGIYENPFIKPFAKIMRAIPIGSRQGPRDIINALRTASEAIKNGEIVAIFAEGQITRTGQMLPFRRGFEKIMRGVEAPIIPAHLDRVWGSVFSFDGHKFIWKWPRRIPYPVTITFGKPMAATSSAVEIRREVMHLATEAWEHRRPDARMIQRLVVSNARKRPRAVWIYDGQNLAGLRRMRVVAGAIALARALRGEWKDQQMVGVALPPSVGGVLVNLACLLAGKIPINLNYTSSAETLQSIGKQCNIETTISARAFLERVPLQLPGRVLHLEDIAGRIGGGGKLLSLLLAKFAPVGMLERSLGAPANRSIDDMAGIIFSSGSTGDPKGVMLSHWNLTSNIEGLAQVFPLGEDDAIMGVLPFFHSFGFMATLWLPLVHGFRAVYHPNPLDARAIGGLVEKTGATLLVATPTFLQAYTKRVEGEQFGSLKAVLVGAEKLRDAVAQAFEQRFGIRPFEGYGTTECSPAVAVNTLDYRAPGFYQVGSKRGSIGQPLPGISIKVVDPDTKEEMPHGKTGLLLVKGPNVMQGYWQNPEKTQAVLVDGWYHTGDIARVDDDGFIEITDRLSRFSKIAGEMVPHIKVEEALQQAAGVSEQVFAVTGIPDEKKGEKLAVLYTIAEEKAKEACEAVAKTGLPNLWLPRWGEFLKVDAIPVLGTGKMDLRKIKETAMARATAPPAG